MRFSTPFVLAFAAHGLAGAIPAEKRTTVEDYNPPSGGDVDILNYALTLEYLERKFYEEGVANYSKSDFIAAGLPDSFYDNLKEILYDEMTHVTLLSGAITMSGNTPVTEAFYSFPSTDAKSFISLASVLEGVGVSAYLGAAAEIANKAYLTVAGSILTVEARHSSYLRAALGESPFPKPFDTPLDFNQVFSLAAQFITGFAPNAKPLPFKAFPPIIVRPTSCPYTAGSSPVTFTHAQSNAIALGLITPSTPVYAVFFSGLNTYYVLCRTTEGNSGDFKIDAIPAGSPPAILAPTGQVYVVLSTADGTKTLVSDENTISGVGLIEVNPVGDRDGVY